MPLQIRVVGSTLKTLVLFSIIIPSSGFLSFQQPCTSGMKLSPNSSEQQLGNDALGLQSFIVIR